MKLINKFVLKNNGYEVFYSKDGEISIFDNSDNTDVDKSSFVFENRKDFYYFINQLTDAAEEIKEIEE